MRVVLRFAVTLSIALAAAGAARAGGLELDPFTGPGICGAQQIAADVMEPPTFFFTGLPDCKALCSKAASRCSSLQRKNSGCRNDITKNQELWARRNCKELYSDPALIRNCQRLTSDEFDMVFEDISSELRDGLSACKGWGETCRNGCDPL